MNNFTDNTAAARFELTEGGAIAYASYRREADAVVIRYVEAAPELRGTGAASRLMTEVATHLRAQNLKARPICSYAVAWFRRHPEYRELLEE